MSTDHQPQPHIPLTLSIDDKPLRAVQSVEWSPSPSPGTGFIVNNTTLGPRPFLKGPYVVNGTCTPYLTNTSPNPHSVSGYVAQPGLSPAQITSFAAEFARMQRESEALQESAAAERAYQERKLLLLRRRLVLRQQRALRHALTEMEG